MADLTQADFDAIPSEAPAAETPVPKKSEKAEGMRKAADLIERLTGLPGYISADQYIVVANDAEGFKVLCRALGTFKKSADDSYFNAIADCGGGFTVRVLIPRAQLCKKVLLREEDVPEQIIPAVPEQRIPASKRQVWGWDCAGSVLGGGKTAASPELNELMVENAGKLTDAMQGQPLPQQPVPAPAEESGDVPF